MQRLFTQAIAGQQQLAFLLVVERKTEHPPQLLKAIGTHLFVQVDNDLGVGVGVKAMTAAFEFGPKLGKVIDFTVKHHPDRPVFIEDGLMAAGNVNNAEAAHTQSGTVLNEDSLIVRTTMNNGLTHPVDGFRLNPISGLGADDSRDSAHALSPQYNPGPTAH